MVTQKKWRWFGGITLACCAAMAVAGVYWDALRHSLLLLVVYWTVFLFLFVLTILVVLLDVRYIRMYYALSKREAFRQTLGDEGFRRELREAQQKARDKARLN